MLVDRSGKAEPPWVISCGLRLCLHSRPAVTSWITMEGPAVENLIDFDMPSSTEGTVPSAVSHSGGDDFFSGEPESAGPMKLPDPIVPMPAACKGTEGDDSDATESADSENEAMDSPSHHSESRRSSSSSDHSAEDPDVTERREFMKAYVEKLFHGR